MERAIESSEMTMNKHNNSATSVLSEEITEGNRLDYGLSHK